ncbi:uncharacterized protein N7484_011155 [Penicillium longicatenatum]|uniref:uncharacterized protein n=1 Tax=Penicillium longicatenatum TaxID=1561947 RepID=UPI002547B829|nr:uncharacterized protein N7484_011155 [Penicillium longicatenatum]KAJ5631055.1 hypothetical protein N7484_011155 [Penicillium longicatenatum]
MPKAQVTKRKNDAQWHRLKIGNDEDQSYRDAVTQVLMGINDNLSVDGLNLRLREAREEVTNAIHEQIDKMPHDITRLHRPTAVKNLYEIFKDQRATWPVVKQSRHDEEKSEAADKRNNAQWRRLKIGGHENQLYRAAVTNILMGINDDLSVDGLDLESREGREDVNNAINEEIERMPHGIPDLNRRTALKNLYEIFRDQHTTWPVAERAQLLLDGEDETSEDEEEGEEVSSSASSVESSDSDSNFDYQSELVLYNAPVNIIKAANGPSGTSWKVNLSTFLERPDLARQQSPNQKWINVQFVRFPYIEKALHQMNLLDAPGSSLWWSWHEPEEIDLGSTKGQIRISNGWDLARAIWRSFEGHFEDFRGPRPDDSVDELPREHDLPSFTLVIRENAPDFGVPLGDVPELEGLSFGDDVDEGANHIKARSGRKLASEEDYSDLAKLISSSERTTAEKRPRDDESDENQSSGKRRQMSAPWEL